MKDRILGTAEWIDRHLLAGLSNLIEPKNVDGETDLCAFLFHRLFNKDELANLNAYSHELFSVDLFDEAVNYFAERDYQFITPSDLNSPEPLNAKTVMLSFDDGYSDNLRALPILEKYGAKAVFYISPKHIIENCRFWWDAIYICGQEQGLEMSTINSAIAEIKLLHFDDAVDEILKRYGEDAFKPNGDIDRPLTVAEFNTLATSKHTEIGNHTFSHTILAPRSHEYMKDELERAEDFFKEQTGQNCTGISYPNGIYSSDTIDTCSKLGYTSGITVEARKNKFTKTDTIEKRLTLGRITLSGSRNLQAQLNSATQHISTMRMIYGMKKTRVD